MTILFRLLIFLALVVSSNAANETADLIIRNARVVTVDHKFSIAQAIAIKGDKILAVGSDRRVAKFQGKETRVVDAQGKTVMPGLYDSHVHSYKASVSTLDGGAPYIRSIADAQQWIREQVARKPAGSWIVLERVYATRMKEMRLPTKAELDEAAPNNPVLWNSGPVAVVNSKALEVSKITRDTPNPTPGEIVKDPKSGEPTGVLRNAASLLKNPTATRTPTAKEQREALKHLHHLYNEQGITSIGERRTETAAIDLFRDMEKSGELTVRVNCTRLMDPLPKTLDEAIAKLDEFTKTTNGVYGPTGVGDDWVRIGPFKIFLDGGMLIGTAYMREPWGVTDIYQITDPKYRGQLFVKPELLNPFYAEVARRGWQVTAHCVGDAAMDVLLDCYETIDKQMDISKRRFLVTHGNFPDEKNLNRCAKLGVVADVQPAWLYKDGDALKKILGERRMEDFFPLKSWFKHHIVVGGGSDHMVQLDSIESTNPWNPWLGMWVALTRHTERGGVDKPEQCLTREEAIRFYTINNCYLNFEEKKKGSLEPGKYADLIMVDRDVVHCPVDDVRGTKVLLTMVGGKVVTGSL
ncbi:MAG: putative TIM-barrel fold metal-dependent hydrolase [Verrucomicrobiales bacterium]|nr:putative TIM-barrel fold metal-dependent hydrolase [Verrucomicrobiales bacterium]